MRLQRNITQDGKCKYAIVRLDKLRALQKTYPPMVSAKPGDADQAATAALQTLERLNLIEYGEPGSPEECFVIKLKDKFCAPTLITYHEEIMAEFNKTKSAIEILKSIPNNSAVQQLEDRATSLIQFAKDLHQLIDRARSTKTKIPD